MMKDFKKIIIAMIVACVIAASCPVSGSIVDAATTKVKSGANVTEVKGSGKKYVAYRGKQAVKPRKGWYKKGNTQYYFDGRKNYATYVWYKKSGKWYLKKWKSGSYKKYTGYVELSNGKTYKFSKGVKGKKASGVVKVSGKYYYYKGGKQTVYSENCGKWKTGKTQYYFGKGNKSATYVYYSGQKVLKKWNKTKKSYQKYTGVFTLSNGTKYVFNNGNRGTIKSSITAGTDRTTAVYKDAKGDPKNVTGWKLVKGVQYYFNNAATASFKIEKDVCWVFITDAKNQDTGNQETNDHWKKYSGVVGRDYYVNGKVDTTPEKDTIATDQSGLRVKWDGKEWKLLTGTYKKLYYVNGDYASGIVDGKYYRGGKLATGICNDKYYKDGILGTGSYNGKRYSKGSLLTGDYKNKFYKNGELYTGIRKSNGKYYVNGELAAGSYKNKYYKGGELYTGIYKSKYYKDGVLGTGTCNGKFYKDGELYTGMRKSNGKYYVDGVLANGTYGGVKYVDGVAQKAEQHVCKWLVVLDKNQNPVQSNYKKHDAVMGTENQLIRDAWDEPIYSEEPWYVCNSCSRRGIDDQECAYETYEELLEHHKANNHGGNHLIKKLLRYEHHDAVYADVPVTKERAYEEWDETYKCTVCGDTMTVHVVCGDTEQRSGTCAYIPNKSGDLVWDDGTLRRTVKAGVPYGVYVDDSYDTAYLTLLKDHGIIK